MSIMSYLMNSHCPLKIHSSWSCIVHILYAIQCKLRFLRNINIASSYAATIIGRKSVFSNDDTRRCYTYFRNVLRLKWNVCILQCNAHGRARHKHVSFECIEHCSNRVYAVHCYLCGCECVRLSSVFVPCAPVPIDRRCIANVHLICNQFINAHIIKRFKILKEI